ncbi:hypothetical protein [Massilia eburnea]|uniref:hypothetical protein n=1 Tax=Massilia eburnea TaxID=1776165 RepID=UPI003D6B3E35
MIRWAAMTLCLLFALAGVSCAQAAPPAAPSHEILVMLHLPAPHFRADGYSGASYRDDARPAGAPAHRCRHWRVSTACR